ncbi:protein of unknown function [Thauera humireducens]|nr:protein of unknown function [Thauera humireducens]CAH1748070.1 protein of unknown function [Thauera humireducens]
MGDTFKAKRPSRPDSTQWGGAQNML